MYGLPKNFSPARLVGRILEMICFNENQLYLHFDEKLAVMVLIINFIGVRMRLLKRQSLHPIRIGLRTNGILVRGGKAGCEYDFSYHIFSFA
jgi:hypothetical protein